MMMMMMMRSFLIGLFLGNSVLSNTRFSLAAMSSMERWVQFETRPSDMVPESKSSHNVFNL